MTSGRWTQEVHDKANIVHAQIAALQQKASDSPEAERLAKVLCEPYFRLQNELYGDEP